jgi:hypothetical protein
VSHGGTSGLKGVVSRAPAQVDPRGQRTVGRVGH